MIKKLSSAAQKQIKPVSLGDKITPKSQFEVMACTI